MGTATTVPTAEEFATEAETLREVSRVFQCAARSRDAGWSDAAAAVDASRNRLHALLVAAGWDAWVPMTLDGGPFVDDDWGTHDALCLTPSEMAAGPVRRWGNAARS